MLRIAGGAGEVSNNERVVRAGICVIEVSFVIVLSYYLVSVVGVMSGIVVSGYSW